MELTNSSGEESTQIRVLLTGASGFVGSHVLEHLLENTTWHIVCVASWKHKGQPERILEVLKGKDLSRVTIITHDIEAPFCEKTITQLGTIDYILNLASQSHVERSITDPVPFVQNNVNLVLNMLELARVLKPRAFLQFSTDEVYGPAPDGVDFTEWSTVLPSNPYSASKAAQEALAISYWRTYNVPVILTNCMNIFGEMQDPEKYVAQLVKKIYLGEEVTVHGSEGNIGSRYYLHARNCADAVLYIIRNLPPKAYGVSDRPDRYNIVGDVEMDNLEMARLVSQIMGLPLKYSLVDFHATRPGHDKRYALDGAKLRGLGWIAPLGFEESLRKYIKWTLERPLWQ